MGRPEDPRDAGAEMVIELPRSLDRRPLARPAPWVVAGGVIAILTAVVAVWLGFRGRGDPERLWVEAELALRVGRREQARAALRRIERLRPKTTRDWVLQAQLAAADGRTDDALAVLARVPAGDPLSAQALLMAGRLERQRRRLRPAEAYFRRAVAADPALIAAHKELIYLYGLQLRRPEVDAEFRALARRTRLSHHDLFTWALTHFTTWRPDVAADLRAYLAADPDDRSSRLALAEILVGQPEGQAEAARLLRERPGSDPEALALRARLALDRGRLDEAEALLDQGPAEHPGLARLRGKLALLRHRPEEAIRHYRRALSSEPYDRVTTSDLARALALVGRRSEAEALRARVRPLNELYDLVTRVRSPGRENEAPDLLKLGAACQAAGLREEARGWFLLAVDRDPLDARAQAALYRLSDEQAGPGTEPSPTR